MLDNLKGDIVNKDAATSKTDLKRFVDESTEMMADLRMFVETRSETNDNFKYWTGFIEIVSRKVIHDLLRADREGNWELHLDAMQRALPIVAAFDSVNYLRWCSVYLEDMRKLPVTAPTVHENFMEGKFAHKQTEGKFKSVGGDQLLEQRINRSQKSSSGIIGNTRRKAFVAQWEIIYHEMLAVSNLHRQVSGAKPNVHESIINHEFSKADTKRNEKHVQSIVRYIDEKGNPFKDNDQKQLQNILTKQIVTDEIRSDLLHVKQIGHDKYTKFRNDRFIDRNGRLADTIHRSNIKTMKSLNEKPKQWPAKKKIRQKEMTERKIAISTARGLSSNDLLQYDIVPSHMLFDEDRLMTKPEKHLLVKELEKTTRGRRLRVLSSQQ